MRRCRGPQRLLSRAVWRVPTYHRVAPSGASRTNESLYRGGRCFEQAGHLSPTQAPQRGVHVSEGYRGDNRAIGARQRLGELVSERSARGSGRGRPSSLVNQNTDALVIALLPPEYEEAEEEEDGWCTLRQAAALTPPPAAPHAAGTASLSFSMELGSGSEAGHLSTPNLLVHPHRYRAAGHLLAGAGAVA